MLCLNLGSPHRFVVPLSFGSPIQLESLTRFRLPISSVTEAPRHQDEQSASDSRDDGQPPELLHAYR